MGNSLRDSIHVVKGLARSWRQQPNGRSITPYLNTKVTSASSTCFAMIMRRIKPSRCASVTEVTRHSLFFFSSTVESILTTSIQDKTRVALILNYISFYFPFICHGFDLARLFTLPVELLRQLNSCKTSSTRPSLNTAPLSESSTL